MVTGDTSEPLAPVSLVIEVRDYLHEVGIAMAIKFMYNMSILGGPEAQDGAWGRVSAPSTGVVGAGA